MPLFRGFTPEELTFFRQNIGANGEPLPGSQLDSIQNNPKLSVAFDSIMKTKRVKVAADACKPIAYGSSRDAMIPGSSMYMPPSATAGVENHPSMGRELTQGGTAEAGEQYSASNIPSATPKMSATAGTGPPKLPEEFKPSLGQVMTPAGGSGSGVTQSFPGEDFLPLLLGGAEALGEGLAAGGAAAATGEGLAGGAAAVGEGVLGGAGAAAEGEGALTRGVMNAVGSQTSQSQEKDDDDQANDEENDEEYDALLAKIEEFIRPFVESACAQMLAPRDNSVQPFATDKALKNLPKVGGFETRYPNAPTVDRYGYSAKPVVDWRI